MDLFTLIDLKTCLAFVVTFLACYLYLNQRKNLPPGPWAPPIIGNIPWLLYHALTCRDSPGVMFHKASQRYGDMLYLRLGRQGVLILNGCDVIQETFVRRGDNVSDRPHWMSDALKKVLKDGRGLLWQSGEDWRKMRRFVLASLREFGVGLLWQSGEDWRKMRRFVLASLREFGVGKTSLEEKILTEVEAASKLFREASTSGEPYDVRRLASLMIANVIYGIVFGKRHEYDDDKFLSIIGKIEQLFKTGGALDFTNRMPSFLLRLVGRNRAKDIAVRLAIVEEIRAHIRAEITDHEDTFDADNIRDFIDLYIQNKRGHEDTHLFNEGNVFRMIMDLFLAGSDTTSNTIIWCILYMTEHPVVQKRCQEEIHETYGDQTIRWSHKNTLPYVEATLMEVQRMSNVAELSLPHTNEEEMTIRGYTIPKHTIVHGNLLSSNFDPRHWDQPHTFNPERFLESGKLKNNVAFMPFSAGPRICVGESLAKMEMFLVFTNFLQRFTFKRENDDVPASFERVKNQITSTPIAFKTRIIQRS